MYACIGAAIGALSGELHGGANAAVMRNLLEIGDVNRVEDWVKAKLDANERIMGMGHAVYKIVDPRASMLSDISEKLAERTGDRKWFDISRKVENVTQSEFKKRKGKDIYPNVDLYSASVYYMMGIAPDLFTPIFAIARMPGWCAHIIEEKFAEAQSKPALYRPSAEYIGRYCRSERCKYIPIERRE